MNKITKKEVYELIKNKLEHNEYQHININGCTLYYDRYKITDSGDGDYYFYFYENDSFVSAYRTYEMNILYLDFTLYEIV